MEKNEATLKMKVMLFNDIHFFDFKYIELLKIELYYKIKGFIV